MTKRIALFGASDTYTGWYRKTFNEVTANQEMIIQDKGATVYFGNIGVQATYKKTGFAVEPYTIDDEVVNASGFYYRIVSREDIRWANSLICYRYELAELGLHADRPTTSGTWHLDSDSVTTDPRHRMKVLLDTYVNDSNVTEDDAVSNATTHTQFANPDYQIYRIFVSKGIDAIASIACTDSKPLYNYNHYPYAFDETVEIELAAINKQGITATNLIEKFEQEIRHVFTDHPLGSIREINSIDHAPRRIGDDLLWTTTLTISYRRANDDYTPTTPAFSYGHVATSILECDRTSGGLEGTWTLSVGGGGAACTQSIDSERNLDLYCTAFPGGAGDSVTSHANSLGLSTTLWTRCRIRYRTTGDSTAKVIINFTGGGSQTVLSETASSNWTVVDVALNTAKTVGIVTLYNCDGVGHVYYDFVEIYWDNYILPNLVEMTQPTVSKDVVIGMPQFSGDLTQSLGTGLMEVTMTCDLDIEPSALTWRLPQTTTPKSTNYPNKLDILMQVQHLSGINVPWVWLHLDEPAMQFKARLVDIKPTFGRKGMVDLTWREYRHGTASTEALLERYGTTL